MIKLTTVHDPKLPGLDLTAPVFFCDGCGISIKQGKEGVYVWGTKGGESTPFKTFHHSGPDHNDRCDAAWTEWEREIESQGRLGQWMMLTDFVVYLTLNLGLEVAESVKETDQTWAL